MNLNSYKFDAFHRPGTEAAHDREGQKKIIKTFYIYVYFRKKKLEK
jgi:hypothetical protein